MIEYNNFELCQEQLIQCHVIIILVDDGPFFGSTLDDSSFGGFQKCSRNFFLKIQLTVDCMGGVAPKKTNLQNVFEILILGGLSTQRLYAGWQNLNLIEKKMGGVSKRLVIKLTKNNANISGKPCILIVADLQSDQISTLSHTAGLK